MDLALFLVLCLVAWLFFPARWFAAALGWLVGLRLLARNKVDQIKEQMKEKDK